MKTVAKLSPIYQGQPEMQQVIPPGTTVVVLAQPSSRNKQELYTNMKHGFSRALIALGSFQLCIGVLCIVFQCVNLGLSGTAYCLAFVGHGIWNGFLFLITGVFGIVGGSRKNRCVVVSFNVFSIISASFTTALLGIATPSAILAAQYSQFWYSDDPTYRNIWNQMNVVIAMESMMAILAVIEGVVAIVSSAFCCAIGACCCGCGGSCCCPTPLLQPQFVALGEHSLQQQQSSYQWVIAQNQPHHQLNVQASAAGYEHLYDTLENAEYSPLDSASSAAFRENSQYIDITYKSEQTS